MSSLLRCDLPAVDIPGELLDSRIGLLDIGAEFRRRCKLRIAEPIVPNHSIFVWVCDRTRFEFAHGRECPLHKGLHLLEKALCKTHSTDVDGELQIVVAEKILLKSGPERGRTHSALRWKVTK